MTYIAPSTPSASSEIPAEALEIAKEIKLSDLLHNRFTADSTIRAIQAAKKALAYAPYAETGPQDAVLEVMLNRLTKGISQERISEAYRRGAEGYNRPEREEPSREEIGEPRVVPVLISSEQVEITEPSPTARAPRTSAPLSRPQTKEYVMDYISKSGKLESFTYDDITAFIEKQHTKNGTLKWDPSDITYRGAQLVWRQHISGVLTDLVTAKKLGYNRRMSRYYVLL